MTVLQDIIQHKREEIESKRRHVSIQNLTQSNLFKRPVKSLQKSIKNGNGIISEFKRKSPSAGLISKGKTLEDTVHFYNKHKVSAISILTDQHYFGGQVEDLSIARSIFSGPILRKDFIIDEYQLFEAKSYGADAILLIAEALDEYHAKYLTTIAKSIGLEVLMEFHSEEELHKLNENVDVIGVNNRNLKTLKTDIQHSFDIIKKLPYHQVKISESGLEHPDQIQDLVQIGYDGFLIGESILKSPESLPSLIEISKQSKFLKHEN